MIPGRVLKADERLKPSKIDALRLLRTKVNPVSNYEARVWTRDLTNSHMQNKPPVSSDEGDYCSKMWIYEQSVNSHPPTSSLADATAQLIDLPVAITWNKRAIAEAP